MSRTSLGELEEVVLLTLLHMGGRGYALEVVDSIKVRTGRSVASATAYMVLRRLETRGFATSRLGEALPERGGRPRRYFEVLDTALPLLQESRETRLALWEGLETLLEKS